MDLLLFVLNAALLGVGLAMDAFSVSLANGLNEPQMKAKRMCAIAGTFCGFQILMPLVGWICIHTIVYYFRSFEKFVPWIALILLLFIGGKMLLEGIHHKEGDPAKPAIGIAALMFQGVATSIDALSVGFTIADYSVQKAVVTALIIGVVTFVLCMIGLVIGKKFGNKLANKAAILGGVILIAIGIEIFVRGILG